jgi:hypothetical protein
MLGDDSPLGSAVIMLHYADIAAKLDQPILAAALGGEFTIPDEIGFLGIVWTFRLGPLQGKRFVGGVYAKAGQNPEFVETNGGFMIRRTPFRLDQPNATFFGVEENIFRSLTQVARVGSLAIRNISQLPDPPFFYSGVSVLRDGSVIAPADFLQAIERVTY